MKTISKIDFFKLFLQKRLYTKKVWVIKLFSGFSESVDPMFSEPWVIGIREGDLLFTDENLELFSVSGWRMDEPLFGVKEKIQLTSEDLPNIKGKVDTTCGIALANALVLCFPFGDKFEYINGELQYGKVEKLVVAAATAEEIGVREIERFHQSTSYVSGLVPLLVPTATPRAMSTAPGLHKRRKELLREHRDKLDDPATAAAIETELASMDKEYIQGDESEIFYKSGKAFAVTRKRMHGMFGAEKDMTDPNKVVTIENSLEEGWDLEKMPEMINTLRMGSFARGQDTALGGVSFKYFVRVFQNSEVAEDDCGATFGKFVEITNNNKGGYVGRTLVKDGKVLTSEFLNKSVGKTLEIRSPSYCQTKGNNFCAKCTGTAVATNPNSIGMLTSNLGSAFLSLFMAAMHGRALELAEMDVMETLS